jgi:hypothetical protein
MTKPSLEFKLKPAISTLRRLKRLPSLHSLYKLLLPLYLFQHEPIKRFILSGCDSEQIMYHALTLYLEVPVLEWPAVHPLLEVARCLLRDAGVAREVHGHQTLGAPQCRAQLKDHHLVESRVAKVQMDQVVVILYNS